MKIWCVSAVIFCFWITAGFVLREQYRVLGIKPRLAHTRHAPACYITALASMLVF